MLPPSLSESVNRCYPECGFQDDCALFVHRCSVGGRWLLVACCWLAFGVPALWFLRGEISLWREFFTWAAVWYAFRANPWPTFGLAVSFGLTLSTLVWQSRNILFGLSASELAARHDSARWLRQQGMRSTLWIWFLHQQDRRDRRQR